MDASTINLMAESAKADVAAFNDDATDPKAITAMVGCLTTTEAEHAKAEKRLPAHDWRQWYAAFMNARSAGMNNQDAAFLADEHIRSLQLAMPEVW